MSRLRHLARDERGFTLTELLMAMVIGSIVLWGLMMVQTRAVTSSMEVTDRVEASQRARLALDRMTTVLDSQLCINATTPAIMAGSTGTDLWVHADLNGVSTQPKRYRFTYDPAARTLTERRYDPTGALGTPTGISYDATVDETRRLAVQVLPARNSAQAQLPVFRYYAFQPDGTVNLDAPLPVPLSAANAPRVVRVEVAFKAVPERTKREDRRSAQLQGQAIAATADPNAPSAGANCS